MMADGRMPTGFLTFTTKARCFVGCFFVAKKDGYHIRLVLGLPYTRLRLLRRLRRRLRRVSRVVGEEVRVVNDTSISDAAEVEDAEGELPVALADDDDARADAAAAMQSMIPPGFVPAAVAASGVRGVWL